MGIQLILLPEEMPTNFLENKSLHQKHVKIVKIFSGEKTENNTYVAAFILVQLYAWFFFLLHSTSTISFAWKSVSQG